MAELERISGYATAIFEVARAEGKLEEVEEELFRVARSFEASDELEETLSDPRLPVERKLAILDDLLEDRVSPLTRGLVGFVVGLGRARDLRDIVDRLVERAAAERDRAVAEVRSAVPLDADRVARLEQALSGATGKRVEAKVVVDPSVIGGLVARVGSTVIDGTVRHRLETLRERLRSVKEA